MGTEPAIRSLALVVDDDHEGRRAVRRMFGGLGFDVVQTSNTLVALELIQRLGQSFQLVLIDLELPGLPGAIVVETLRLFRPELPVLCIGNGMAVGVLASAQSCLGKPLQADELRARVDAALTRAADPWSPAVPAGTEVVLRARARYAERKNLVDAALELAQGYQGE
jgi:DNA-binding response OmpR family regulator